MDNVYNRPVVRKKTVCKSTPTFGFSEVNELSKETKFTHKRLHSQGRVLSANDLKEAPTRKIAKIYASQDSLHEKNISPRRIVAEQKTLWRQKTKTEEEIKKNDANRKKENLKELHEKSKLLLQQNLRKKTHKVKTVPNDASVPKNENVKFNTPNNEAQISEITELKNISNIENNDDKPEEINVPIESEDIPVLPREDDVSLSDNVTNISVLKDKAAITIQKHFRGFTARKNIKKQKEEIIPTVVEDVPECNKNACKLHTTIYPDLYVDYPYNIMSSVKNKLFIAPDTQTTNMVLTLDEKNSGASHIEMKKITSSTFNYNSNDTSVTLFPENSVVTDVVSLHSEISKSPITESMKKNFNVVSGLKSSLEEIKNLTSSFSHIQDSKINKHQVSVSTGSNTSLSYTGTITAISKDNTNILNAPEINLIWLRHSNKKLTPQSLQNSFQDELNLLESFNDSLRQVQHIEQSLTSFRKDDSSLSQIERNQGDLKQHESTEITFLGSSDISTIHKINDKHSQTQSLNYQSSNKNNSKPGHVSTKQFVLQKCFENEKSLILSQKGNITCDLSDTSIMTNSDNDSIIENNVESCISSMDLSCYGQKRLFDFNDYKNVDMTSRLNKFCLCLVSQYIEDEKVRSEYLNTLLKVREKTLLDATRNELLCLEIQKKHNQSQVPLLKKKQRGLLLKLQQERNEIKHIKKFQQEQSQERKASLRRQLKHLKQMLACDQVLMNMKKKNKNSSAILHTSTNSLNSPLKGINITLGNETQNSNNSLTKIWEGLEKRRQDLNEQKKKMHDLLHLHFNNIFDTTEIKVIQDKLAPEINKLNICNKTDNTKNNTPEVLNNSRNKIINEDTMNKRNLDLEEYSQSCKCISGNTLNTLWEKITGHKLDKFENNKFYNMTKDSMDVFFNDAKQVAINNILSTLQNNVSVESPKQEPTEKPLAHCLTSNKIENTSFLNNLLKSEGRELADLISKGTESQQELTKKTEKSFTKSEEHIYTENLSNDGSDPSDTSKSTAHSLVEELSYLYPAQSENENQINNTPSQIQSGVIPQTDDIHINDSNEIECEQVNTKNICSQNLSKEKDSPNPTKSLEKSVVVENVDNVNSNCLPPFQDGKNINKDAFSPTSESKLLLLPIVKNQKPKKVLVTDKSVNTNVENSIIKSDLFIENTIDLVNKRFYTDDRNISRLLDNKSPINAEYLSGSWESVSPSPDPSPRDSPTGEYSPAAAAASLPLCHLSEAEELRRKQLAIELEIKALEQQQTQLPYCLVREIPDKPPPPYIPPSQETKVIVSPVKAVVEPKTPPSIPSLIESFCLWLWPKFANGKANLITYSDYCNVNKFTTKFQDYVFIFDVCFETFEWEFAQLLPSNDDKKYLPWEYKKEANNINKHTDKVEMCTKVQNKVKELIGIETTPIRENLIISWTQKRQDFLNNLLIKELYKEEADWLNIEPFEMDVKNNLVNSILDSLVLEACNELMTFVF